MIVVEAIAVLAAAALSSAATDKRNVKLGVTATVVRPAQVSTMVSGGQVEVVATADSADAEVVADGGTITRVGRRTKVVPRRGAESLKVTIIY